jgi:WD40 repeat protein
LSLALVLSPVEDADANRSEASTLSGLAPADLLGERYQIRELLGRGGQGEVYRAFDLKLRVDVALKSVRPGRAGDERAREQLRREVRAAREVVSPNVCRIFDLVDEGGQELLSMEYIDGKTLGETLEERGPLALEEARPIASQFLSGLEAIHEAGLVHRDFKPENVMLTRAGRVVVMDFGVAKGKQEERTGTVSGTPAYMAPEQARGDRVDARADVYAAGVVVAEMISVGSLSARQELWRAVRETPPRVPEGPWAAVLRRALDPRAEGRQASARVLSRELEEVTLRLPGFEEKRPYPGLSSFTEEDKEYFFGREVETESVWKKLKRPRLLGLVGPSGAGKSSFLRAGLLPALPPTWRAVRTTPGTRPFASLAQALVPQLAGDTEALQELVRFEEPDAAVSVVSRWRKSHEHVMVVVDQFEELFTQNPKEVQEAFASLLGRLVLEADAHVVISLRDDFLIHCHEHEALSPILSDLTLLGPLSESGLRRALVQPALACGYRFEDEALVEEMVSAVRGERGALPLLAFASSRLWELRDRERGLLTREAYREIGGVAGALAQHAEATLERIGTQRAPSVRELFRNLVTASGTRAVRERDELLSVFEGKDREEAEEVLKGLVDARLLTQYERAGEGGESHPQVEIVHESLLSAWPRLVRWQTQDADGAQLRDQLRQAARLWEDRGRKEDVLWTGPSFREFAVWKESYPQALTTLEEEYARAMTARATRQRRRRRLALSAAVAVLATGLAVVAGLWRRSEASRERAEAETQRAEASKVLALGQLEFLTYPTAALAYALKSLELSDSREARLFALRVLQSGPAAIVAPSRFVEEEGTESVFPVFSPSGEWLALGGTSRVQVLHQDGREPLVLGDYPSAPPGSDLRIGFGPEGDVLVTNQNGDVRTFSFPEGGELFQAQHEQGPTSLFMRGRGFFTVTTEGTEDAVRWWTLDGRESRLVGTMETIRVDARGWTFDRRDVDGRGDTLAYARGRRIYLRSLERWAAPERLLAEHAAEVVGVRFHPNGNELAASDASGEILIWPTTGDSVRPIRTFRGEPSPRLAWDPAGRWLAAASRQPADTPDRLWDLAAPPGAEPLVLRRGPDTWYWVSSAFHPSGLWLATGHFKDAAFWPLVGSYPRVLTGHQTDVRMVRFSPDGQSLISSSTDETREWPFAAEGDEPHPPLNGLYLEPGWVLRGVPGGVEAEPLAGGPVRRLTGFENVLNGGVAVSLDGRRVAAGPSVGLKADKVIRVWDLETGEVQVVLPVPGAGDGFEGGVISVRFLDQDRLLASGRPAGLFVFNLRDGTTKVLASKLFDSIAGVSRHHDFGMGVHVTSRTPRIGELVRFDLEGGVPNVLASHGSAVQSAALDPTDTWVATGSFDGIVRIGSVTGGEPYYFFGHEGTIYDVSFSPDGKWLASGGEDKKIRLWPVPDGSKPPFHTLPREELLSKLRALTNLRVVPDPGSGTGYKVGVGPFPGWVKVPEW